MDSLLSHILITIVALKESERLALIHTYHKFSVLHWSYALLLAIYDVNIILRIPNAHSSWLWLNPRICTDYESRLRLTV